MEISANLLVILHQMGITFGVGSSTFALLFYIKALEDGEIDPSEKNFLHGVYFVLRLGMLFIFLSLLLLGLLWWSGGQAAELWGAVYLFKWIALAVIFINAINITRTCAVRRSG